MNPAPEVPDRRTRSKQQPSYPLVNELVIHLVHCQ